MSSLFLGTNIPISIVAHTMSLGRGISRGPSGSGTPEHPGQYAIRPIDFIIYSAPENVGPGLKNSR